MEKIVVGKTIREAVERKKSELPNRDIIAKKMGLRSRSQVWNILNSDEMEPKYVIFFGELLGENFIDQFKGLDKYKQLSRFEDPPGNYHTPHEDLKDELLSIQRKYIELLEENKSLQEELRRRK